MVPGRKVGKIIGSGGATINQIREDTGAEIDFSKGKYLHNICCLKLQFDFNKLNHAIAIILTLRQRCF